ncbi:hypothetical protein LFM09_29785 [Lentzea alba]|uniref:hypothetical protein n=1 Tax=Lentzea alba TaxID=2714351 RepID=UPI0039BFE8A5
MCFEPLGTSFTLFDGQSIYLRRPADRLTSIEVVHWPNGVAVWVPHPGDDFAIVDSEGNELDRLQPAQVSIPAKHP